MRKTFQNCKHNCITVISSLQNLKNISKYTMNFDLDLFLTALGLAFIFETLPWIVIPKTIRKRLYSLSQRPSSHLRAMGLFALGFGLWLIWISRN